ncbi:RNA-directed DNA polymerase, eukaryota, reverse transcriptase zinc-binding domain protein [Tanacetum coccineum]
MKDLSGTIPGTIHHKVIGEGGYGNDITVGAALILANVSVFSPKPSMHYLNITKRNVVKVFRKNTVPGSRSASDSLVRVLDYFFRASGLRINMCKSKIMGVNVEDGMVKNATSKLGCLVLKTPFTYLGTKVEGNMSRKQAWIEVVDKVLSRLSRWKMKLLSIGGRLTLLKSVLGSMPIFHMSIFKVPSSILKSLESIRSRFFNGQDPKSNKASWVKWNKVLTPKDKGGLGVSSLFALNRGLMLKWVWRFYSQKCSLWTKVIKAIYGEDGNLNKDVSGGVRTCWTSIVHEVRVLQGRGINVADYIRLKLGNGENTRFWVDNWYEGGVIKELFPRMFALELNKNATVSSKLNASSLDNSFRRKARSGIEEMQLNSLAEISRMTTLVPCEDRYVWTLESDGVFSVASIRKEIDGNRFQDVSLPTRWVKSVPIKVNIIAWKVKSNALPTRFNISRRGMDIDSIVCPICNADGSRLSKPIDSATPALNDGSDQQQSHHEGCNLSISETFTSETEVHKEEADTMTLDLDSEFEAMPEDRMFKEDGEANSPKGSPPKSPSIPESSTSPLASSSPAPISVPKLPNALATERAWASEPHRQHTTADIPPEDITHSAHLRTLSSSAIAHLITQTLNEKIPQQIAESLDGKLPQLITQSLKPYKLNEVLKAIRRDLKVLYSNIEQSFIAKRKALKCALRSRVDEKWTETPTRREGTNTLLLKLITSFEKIIKK